MGRGFWRIQPRFCESRKSWTVLIMSWAASRVVNWEFRHRIFYYPVFADHIGSAVDFAALFYE